MHINLDELPDSALLREVDLVGMKPRPATKLKPARERTRGLFPWSHAQLWRMAKDGRFPAPVRVSIGITAWKAGDVRRWVAEMGGAQ